MERHAGSSFQRKRPENFQLPTCASDKKEIFERSARQGSSGKSTPTSLRRQDVIPCNLHCYLTRIDGGREVSHGHGRRTVNIMKKEHRRRRTAAAPRLGLWTRSAYYFEVMELSRFQSLANFSAEKKVCSLTTGGMMIEIIHFGTEKKRKINLSHTVL